MRSAASRLSSRKLPLVRLPVCIFPGSPLSLAVDNCTHAFGVPRRLIDQARDGAPTNACVRVCMCGFARELVLGLCGGATHRVPARMFAVRPETHLSLSSPRPRAHIGVPNQAQHPRRHTTSTTAASPHSPRARPSASSCSYPTTIPSNPSCQPRPTSPTLWAPLVCACSRRDQSTSRSPHRRRRGLPRRHPTTIITTPAAATTTAATASTHPLRPRVTQAWHLATVEPAGEGTPPTAARAERLADAATMALDLISRVKESDAFELVPCQLDPELGPAVCDPRCHPQARVCPAPSAPST